MQITELASAPPYEAGNLREGTLNSKVLLAGREGSLNNYRLSYESAEESWTTPRHRHNFDQIRFPIVGVVDYGKSVTVPPGSVAYFPESVYYGPQVRPDGSETLVLQLGGASGNGFMSPRERRAGFDALRAKGTFERGAYTYVDEKGGRHRQDAYEAVWEHIRGRKLEYAKPRVDGQVVMNPANYKFLPQPGMPGVAVKKLASFTERQLDVSLIAVDAGATLVLAPYKAPQVLFLARGSVGHRGKAYGVATAFGLDIDEGPVELAGMAASELLHIRLPIFTAEEHAAWTGAQRAAA